VAQQLGAGLRERDPPRRAGQQRGAELPFEAPDQVAEGRPADAEPLGRAPEVQLGGDRPERLELAQLHGLTLAGLIGPADRSLR
jgi:hypothetical protein